MTTMLDSVLILGRAQAQMMSFTRSLQTWVHCASRYWTKPRSHCTIAVKQPWTLQPTSRGSV